MHRSEGYNSPKGEANNAAQQQASTQGVPQRKGRNKPIAAPVQPVATPPAKKDNKQ